MYTLKINKLYIVESLAGFSDPVVNVAWTLVGTDGVNTAEYFNNTNFSVSPDQIFIPFDELTESQVANWVRQANGSFMSNYEQIVSDKLALLANPLPKALPAPLPWVHNV
jgi:hypothetical protein